MRKFALFLMALLLASPAWADVSITRVEAGGHIECGIPWDTNDGYDVACHLHHGFQDEDGLTAFDSHGADVNGDGPTVINFSYSDNFADAVYSDSDGENCYVISATFPTATIAPGANHMYASAKSRLYWISNHQPMWQGSYKWNGVSDAEGEIVYRNDNGGWIRVTVELTVTNPGAAVSGIDVEKSKADYDGHYRVFNELNNPVGTTINTAGRISFDWNFDESVSATGTRSEDFVRHNIYGSMVSENYSTTWSSPQVNYSTKTARAVFYVPASKYFSIKSTVKSAAKYWPTIGTTELADGSYRDANCKIQIIDLLSVSASQVPTEWGGTMGNKPSPNTSVP